MRLAAKSTKQKYYNKLKFCNSCNYVWEISIIQKNGSICRYNNMPTFGLPRETCRICNEKKI